MFSSMISRQILTTPMKRFYSIPKKHPLKATLIESELKAPHLKIRVQDPTIVLKIIEALETKHYTIIAPNSSNSSAPSIIPKVYRDIFLL